MHAGGGEGVVNRPASAAGEPLGSREDRQGGQMENGKPGAVVVADDVTRRYGEGDTAVDALKGVSLEVGRAS